MRETARLSFGQRGGSSARGESAHFSEPPGSCREKLRKVSTGIKLLAKGLCADMNRRQEVAAIHGRPSGTRVGLNVVVAALLLIGCTNEPHQAVDTTTADVIALPNSHPAVLLLNDEPSYQQFVDGATERDLEFLCAQSGWRLCLVQAEGVLAVIPFDNPASAAIRIESDGLATGELTIPIGSNDSFGLRSSGGEVTVVLEINGREAGSMMGLLPDSNG